MKALNVFWRYIIELICLNNMSLYFFVICKMGNVTFYIVAYFDSR